MDRIIVSENELIKAADICKTNLFTMIQTSKLAKAILGDSTLLNDLTCVPTTPASLNVLLNPGEIYKLDAIDSTPYGALPADTTHQILKTGILMDAQTFAITPPATPGQSINYLIQINYANDDILPENRPFFGAPSQIVDTVRQGQLVANLKAGVPANTGTQVTPTPDAGYVGAWVITVANGQSTISSGNITPYTNAPFIIGKLQDKISQAQGDARYPLASAFANSVAANGYQRFPGGLIMQWGNVNIPSSGISRESAAVTFPIAFPTQAFTVTTSYTNHPTGLGQLSTEVESLTASGFDFAVDTGSGAAPIDVAITGRWIAIGH